jgi:hypothetical protein
MDGGGSWVPTTDDNLVVTASQWGGGYDGTGCGWRLIPKNPTATFSGPITLKITTTDDWDNEDLFPGRAHCKVSYKEDGASGWSTSYAGGGKISDIFVSGVWAPTFDFTAPFLIEYITITLSQEAPY